MDYKLHLEKLYLQKAELKTTIETQSGFTISVEKHQLLTMLGCVELQISISEKRLQYDLHINVVENPNNHFVNLDAL